MSTNLTALPDNLPVPEDDGGARHLPGMRVLSAPLAATTGRTVDLSALRGRTVVYAYPMTGVPGSALPEGWDNIPGARGCTVEALSFKDHQQELAELGAAVFGLSTQTTEYQREMAERLHLPFAVLSDEGLALAHGMCLPTMEVEGRILLKRLTMVLRDGVVEHVFYPVFPPNEAAREVLEWLRRSAGTA
jgi:peroxiredoxin